MDRKRTTKKPRFNLVQSVKSSGVSVGYLALGILLVILAPILWEFLIGKGAGDKLRRLGTWPQRRRAARRQAAEKE